MWCLQEKYLGCRSTEIDFACVQYLHFPEAIDSPLFFSFVLLYTISICLILSKILTFYLSLCDNECRSSPSYVFSSAWRLLSAHGPFFINLTLCAGCLIILTYLYDSDLTSSAGLGCLSLSRCLTLFVSGLMSWTYCKQDRWKKPQHQKHQNHELLMDSLMKEF